jgi:Rieske Fe-S protein
VDHHGPDRTPPHVPPPSLWPIGFAVGVAVLLTGLIVGWWIVLLGAVLTILFGFLWIRDVSTEIRGHAVPEIEPETRTVGTGAAPAGATDEAALPVASDEEVERFPRSVFLEGATLGLGGVIGGLVTVPALGFAVIPAFTGEAEKDIDVGALDAFPNGEWRIVTFMEDPAKGEVTRRTAFVRANGQVDGRPSFTILANNCVHLGCPVQPSGIVNEDEKQEEEIDGHAVTRIPTQPAAFACPCHGGAYDTEGNRTAGPPVRALDRYEFSIREGRLVLTGRYSVGEVKGEGAEARISKYSQAVPGVHVDGIEQILYPIAPPK